MKYLTRILGLCCCLSAATAGASCLDTDRLSGVNMAGAEFGKVPGRLNYDYMYPTRQELEKLAEFGGNTLRLPVRWERVRPTADGALNASEVQQIAATYNMAKDLDLCLIVDLHNYGKYYAESLKDNAVLQASFTDTWLQLAAALPDTGHVALGLMNEPVHLPVSEWAALAQSTVVALRQQNHAHLVLVAAGRWSGAHDWYAGAAPNINADAFATFADPLNQYAIEVHQYADSDYSGTHDVCKEAKDFERIFSRISEWAVAHGHRLFLGEFGVAGNARCLDTLEAFLDMTKAAPWTGWTYWAGGRWWGDYSMAVSLKSMSDSPQWAKLHPALMRDRGVPVSDPGVPAAPAVPPAPAPYTGTLHNMVIDADMVLASDVKLGENVKFASAAKIPAGLDLTDALRKLNWSNGDLRTVVDLSDDVRLPALGAPYPTLIRSIQALGDYAPAGNGVRQRSSGELLVSAQDFSAIMLPMRVTMAGAADIPGSYINADGDAMIVTTNSRVVLGHPTLGDKVGFARALATLGLSLGFDARANLIAREAPGASHYFSARPDILVVPAESGQVGIHSATVPGLRNAEVLSVVFEGDEGALQRQAIVPVPADWLLLKASLSAQPGMSDVQIDAQGIVSVTSNGVQMRGRSDYRVASGYGALAQPDGVVFVDAGDANGDGTGDFMMVYPNGDGQLLLIYP